MISPKWSELAKNWLGNNLAHHCHWYKYMKSEEGEVRCTNKKSEFCDGDRIRGGDGLYCAKECGFFELDDWYTDDKNYEEYFEREEK